MNLNWILKNPISDITDENGNYIKLRKIGK